MPAPDGTHPKLFQALQMYNVLDGLDLVVSHIQGGEFELMTVHTYVKNSHQICRALDVRCVPGPRFSLDRCGWYTIPRGWLASPVPQVS